VGQFSAGGNNAALKMQESVGIPAFAYSTAEYLHDPIAAASPDDRVELFSGTDAPMESNRAVTTALLARGVPSVCLGGDQTPETQLPLPLSDAQSARASVLAYIAQLTCAELAGLPHQSGRASTLRKVTQTH